MHRLALALLLALAWMPVQAQEQDQARAILNRALHAVGADRSTGTSSAATWTTKVTVHGLGDPIVYVSEWAFRSPERVRVRMTGTFHGRPFERLLVINGDHGWIKQEDAIQELDRDRLTEEKERLYEAWVATLIPLRAADFDLTALHRNKAGHQQLGLRVKQAGHRAVVLYFDEVDRLAESETRRKDPTSGVEKTETVRYQAYRAFDGIQRATRLTVRVDGKLLAEATLTHYTRQAQLADGLFQRPE